MKSRLAVLAYALLALSLLVGILSDLLALVLLLIALALALAGNGSAPAQKNGGLWICLPLGGTIAYQLYGLAAMLLPALAGTRPHWPVWAAVAVMALVALSYALPNVPFGRWRFVVAPVVFVLLGGWLIREFPRPIIDVWILQQGACKALLHGNNPYATEYSGFPDLKYIGAPLQRDGKILSFPYPPLNIIVDVPAYLLLGDVRWGILLAQVASVLLFVWIGRKLGLPPGHPAELAPLSLLANPWALFMVAYAWTEPLLSLAVALAGWALVAGRQRTLLGSLAAVCSLKQYGILCLIAFWRNPRLRWKELAWVLGISVAIALPLVFWGPSDFWRGVVEFHTSSPFRESAPSLSTFLYHQTGYQLRPAVGFIVASLVAAWVLWRGLPDLASIMLGSSAILMAFFALSKAAHANYWSLVLALLALATVAAAAGPGPDELREPETAEEPPITA
jgi:hypothetical protein